MALKQRHKTRWKGGKQHKVGLNTDRDMACSSKRETNVFEIQTKDIRPKKALFRACLHGGAGPQVGEVNRLGGERACPYNLSF